MSCILHCGNRTFPAVAVTQWFQIMKCLYKQSAVFCLLSSQHLWTRTEPTGLLTFGFKRTRKRAVGTRPLFTFNTGSNHLKRSPFHFLMDK